MCSLVSPAANSENVLIANLVYTNIIYNAVPFYKFQFMTLGASYLFTSKSKKINFRNLTDYLMSLTQGHH